MYELSYSEKTAIVIENGVVQKYSPGTSNLKVFSTQDGRKLILSGDKGKWWEQSKKSTEYCEYAELWLGEYPYSSWAWAIRICKVSGKVEVSTIETCINCRGKTEQDLFREECLTYVA